MKLYLIAFLTATYQITGFGQEFERKVQSYNDTAYYFFYYDNYERAIEYYEISLSLDSNNYDSNYYIGHSLASAGRLEEGLRYFAKALLLDSITNRYITLSSMGGLSLDLSLYDQAAFYFSKLIEEQPDAEIYLMRGKSYNGQEDYQNAINDFNKAIELGETTAEVYYLRAYAFYMIENYEDAFSDFNICIELGGDFPWTYYFLGELFFKYQSYRNALFHFTAFLNSYTDDKRLNANAVLKTGISYYFLSEFEESLAYLEKAIMVNPNNVVAYVYKGMACLGLYEIDNARTNIQIALTKDPESSMANHQMGLVEHINNNNDKAFFHFQIAKENAKVFKDEFTLYGLANTYLNLSDTTSAMECLNETISLNPNHFKALEARLTLNILSYRSDENEILDDYHALFNIFKEVEDVLAYYHAHKSLYLFGLGHIDSAFSLLHRAIELDPFPEYYCLKAFYLIESYLESSTNLTKRSIPRNVQAEALNNISQALKSNHRKADVYLLQATIFIASKKLKDACRSATEGIKHGANISSEQMEFICKRKSLGRDIKEWRFVFDLSSFEKRFSD